MFININLYTDQYSLLYILKLTHIIDEKALTDIQIDFINIKLVLLHKTQGICKRN